jgi:tRNA(Ile2) C34 agmatinyltransferase TiaS
MEGKIIENGKFEGFRCKLCNTEIRNENRNAAYKLLMQHLKTAHSKDNRKPKVLRRLLRW